METLPQLPEPYLWTCENCDGPNYSWDLALPPERYDQGVPLLDALRPRLCPKCVFELAKLAGPERCERTRIALEVAYMERELLGLPAQSTLLGFELPGIEGPFHTIGVGVDYWPLSLPHFVLDWGTPGCAPQILVLRLLISTGWMRGPVWQMRWSWAHPELEPTLQYIKGKTAPTRAEWDKLSMALRRFHSIADDARRPRGTTLYSPGEFRERAAAERREFERRHGRPPYDTELAPLVGVSESTFKRYKVKGWLLGTTRITDTS